MYFGCGVWMFLLLFVFFEQKTAYEMRISDWSSDVCSSDLLLLLDEPTNYLDLEGTMWLEDYVRRYPHTVIVISHDRDMLNNAVNSIVHLDQKKLTFYRGGYDQFERQKAEADDLQMKAKAKNEAARKHLQSFIDRFKDKATKPKQAQSMVKALERMGTVETVAQDNVPTIRSPT